LSGLVRCARCEGAMVAGQFGAARQPKYRCATSKTMGPEACRGGYVMASFVEDAVLAWLEEVAAAEVDQVGDALAGTVALRVSSEGEQRRLARELVKVEEALLELNVQAAEQLLTREEANDVRTVLRARRAEKVARLDDLAAEARRLPEDPAAAAQGLVDNWRHWPVAQRRERLGELMRCVLVTTGRPHATFDIRPVWE
ncbi:MAG: hypothetical protein JWR27_2203, partial [Aeromicrobium sp.]|nr:hypothetical protein [Aeromicrobium sp.]